MTHDDLTFECGKAAGLQDMAARKDAAYASGGRACNVWILDAAADLLATPQAPTQGEDAARQFWDAELGRTAMRFVDRAGDVHPGIDDADTICADFYAAMAAVIARMPWVKELNAARAAQAQGDKT